MRSIEVKVDGAPLGETLTAGCPGGTCPPALSRTVAFDPATYADGTHTVSVSVSLRPAFCTIAAEQNAFGFSCPARTSDRP